MSGRAALDLITYTPLEEIVYLSTYDNPATTVDTHIRFPNLRALSYDLISLPEAFPDPTLIADEKVFPSLEYVSFERP